MKSKILNSETILPVRTTLRFSDLCRTQSKVYPAPEHGGAKLSAARFLKEAAKEKLIRLGIDKDFIKSIT
jgi:hypothetical protein